MSLLAGVVSAFSFWLGIYYRENLTNYVHERYFNGDVALQLNTMHKDIDNPDQRITTDVDNFTSGFDTFGIMNILQVAILAAAVPIVSLFIAATIAGWIVMPLILVVIILVFFMSAPFVSFIGKLEYNLSKEEGNFRYRHIEIRENAEAIAFYSKAGTDREKKYAAKSLERVLDAQWSAVKGRAFFNTFYHIIVGNARIISLVVVLGAINYSFPNGLASIPTKLIYGLVSQSASMAQTAIINGITVLSIMGPLGQNNGRLSRIAPLFDKMNGIISSKKMKRETGKQEMKSSLRMWCVSHQQGRYSTSMECLLEYH